MTVSNPATVSIVVLILAGLLLVQALIWVATLLTLLRKAKALDVKLNTMSNQLVQQVTHIRLESERFEVIGPELLKFRESLQQWGKGLSEAIARADQSVAEGLSTARQNLIGGSRQFEASLLQFSRQTSKLQDVVRRPSIQASAILHGGLTGLRYLIRQWKTRSHSTPVSDQEEFI